MKINSGRDAVIGNAERCGDGIWDLEVPEPQTRFKEWRRWRACTQRSADRAYGRAKNGQGERLQIYTYAVMMIVVNARVPWRSAANSTPQWTRS